MNERSQIYTGDDGSQRIHREKPSRRIDRVTIEGEDELGKHWQTSAYYGCLRRYREGSPLDGGEYAILSISALDETARHDWRDFQQIKNLLLGEEWEALELYPAESRLKDPSNRYYLWCFPPSVVPWGFTDRLVLDMDESIAPQRPFPR